MRYEIISHRQTRDPEEAAGRTMTVGELRDYLAELDQEAPIIVSGFDGHLYNSLDAWDAIIEVQDDGEEADE